MFSWFKKDIDKQILKTKIYVPYEILEQSLVNTNIQKNGIVTMKNGYKITTYLCGCKFEQKIKDFGYSNHWCDEHAPHHPCRSIDE